MDTLDKLRVLSNDSRYDLACACGTLEQEHRRRGTDGNWLYPVTLPNGGRSILLKTLLSNACVNDCRYCPLRSGSNARRCALTPDETARVFMDYLARRDIFGLFLSSGVAGTPDATMAQLIAVAARLRRRHGFRGYIHLKLIPGASDAAVEAAVGLASAVSLNIETPGAAHCAKLSSRKRFLEDIIRPLRLVSRLTRPGERYARVRTTTQFVVGASDETDTEIVRYVFGLYRRLGLDRVYFSAYQAGQGAAGLPGEAAGAARPDDRLRREHRLYQADFLIRKYGFREADILFGPGGNLPLDRDPKRLWADRHPEFFPVHVNQADREALLRVPGLGPLTVARLLERRRAGRLTDLAGLGLRGTRLREASRLVTFA